MTRQLLTRSLAVLLTTLSAGCDALDSLDTFDCHGYVQHQTSVVCDYSGEAQLTSPTFPVSSGIVAALPCPEAPDRCVQVNTSDAGNTFRMTIAFGPIDEGTYSLRGNGVPSVSGTISTTADYTSPLVAEAGTLVIAQRDGQHVAGTFAVHVASQDGQHHFELADGTFNFGSDCRTRDDAVCVPSAQGF